MVARASDPELYKDKIEVSLDGRQIFYLFFGGAVVACLVFVLGVMVGRRLEARAHVDRAAASSAARDPLAALDRLSEAHGEMMFPAALGGPHPSAAAAADQAMAQLAAPAAAPEGDEAAPGPVTQPEAAKPDPKKADKKGDKGDKAADKGDKAADKLAKGDKPADKSDKAADKLAKADKPADKPDAGGKFTLQLSAFQDEAEANAFLATVKQAGYSAYMLRADVDGQGTFFRVRAGTYGSYDEALAAKAEFEKKVPKIAYVTRL